MTRFLTRLRARLRDRLRRDDGSATIEFVILFPVFVSIFGSAMEAGLLNLRQVMLERATDVAVRDLRLGLGTPPTHDELKAQVCELALVIPDCLEALHIELVPIDLTAWNLPTGGAQCVDRDEDIEPAVNFTNGGSNELMIVRICAVFRPILPTTGLGLKLPKVNTTDYAIVSMSAFVNEPT